MTTITAYTDFRIPYTFVAKAEVYRWEDDFGVTVDCWPVCPARTFPRERLDTRDAAPAGLNG